MLRTVGVCLFCEVKQRLLHSYQIYDASAGSGKTFTLVKEYLKLILAEDGRQEFRRILAITFTNKAVNEMKQRILKSLSLFASDTEKTHNDALFLQVSEELSLPPAALCARSGRVLREILHNYAFFDISTIDKFNHRIIRTFARDLKLPHNFEVVLDKDLLLSEGIDRMLGNARPGNRLTDLIVDFALEKIEEGKSWDVSYDLNKVGSMLFDENHLSFLKVLKNKDTDAFLDLQKNLKRVIRSLYGDINKMATEVLKHIAEAGLERSDFRSGWFPDFMKKMQENPVGTNYKADWKANFGDEALYSKSLSEHKKTVIDGLMPRFTELWTPLREAHNRLLFLRNIYQNLVPLTLLNALQKEIDTLLEERVQIHISAFNTLISGQIRDQPAPFIYERLGEKYRHYFIDEFQDTSLLQWRNLVPLISHALQSEDLQGRRGSLFLVGDAKQAIYRWRGGRSELFLNLIHGSDALFGIPPETKPLQRNFRSYKEVVNFNNRFFTSAVPYLNNELYRQLFFQGNNQEHTSLDGGLVSLRFLEKDTADRDLYHCTEVMQVIGELLEKNVPYRDICVLVRSNIQGVKVARQLMEKRIPVISSDALLLESDPSVRFLINLLKHASQTTDLNVQYDLLLYLSKSEGRHAFISKNLSDLPRLFKNKYDFDTANFARRTPYDALEYAIEKFGLADVSHAFISALLDEILEFEKHMESGINSFLDHWEKNKGNWSIPAPENTDAVQLMTIHKSKGLEFPFVIFPFANANIYDDRGTQLWVNSRDEVLRGFDHLLLSKKAEMEGYNDASREVYLEEEHKQELDAFNVLYVALTRGIQGVYVISEMDLDKNGVHKTNLYSGLFINFLIAEGLWDRERSRYDFGKLGEVGPGHSSDLEQESIPYTYSTKSEGRLEISTRAGELWGTARELALSRGNHFHFGMSIIESGGDIPAAVSELVSSGTIPLEEEEAYLKLFTSIVEHPRLAPFYESGPIIKNEQALIAENGVILRPDRMVFEGLKVSVLDYKTGIQSPAHADQLNSYSEVLSSMGYQVENKVLIYVGEQIKPVFI
ncbi:ATP-dependent exoDNAse (exonuclease V) beta subunit (contains helicase and exonuclease domains) [Muriicola jejuensis]|uniref:DNA 3'-5' helicase n=1 Tax=Muriicola jejuensis TaxID=504488 RepID=A0A6P0UIT2_9FLAO|nr:UvrD-helicase domain-containing protein [Muriicola jejuensis]NER10106.1 UvrD-helicase domain-containing protein [Muriicola jejuensis]SMP02878.1 ATP-dependent exoDNAse (exonuclease V) beta subunit (contains helicase and exonuclease domains) [Muriicola jejuensis]